jgi:predicted permease
MSRVAEHVRTLHDPLAEPAKPATALVWPGSPAPLPLEMNKGLRWTILLIIVATGMVLAIACANVASLQLARARSREHELRTRLSLGASRLRLVRQLLTESVLVGVLAGPLALLCTWALLKKLGDLLSQAFSYNGSTVVFNGTPDLGIFAFVFAISLFAGMLSGLAPAMESSRAALATVVGAGSSSVRSRRLQSLLVTAQVSLSLVLLITAGMLIRSSLNALHSPTGYDNRQVIFLGVGFTRASEYTDDHKLTLIRELRSRLAALPGVAAITSARPPAATQRFETVAIPLDEGSGEGPNAQSMLGYTYVEANYFQTLGIPVLLGRGFQPQSREPERSVILSESAANQLWPNQNPIGRSLRLGPTDEQDHPRRELVADGPAYQVVGVARDKRVAEFHSSLSNEVYLPLRESQLSSRPILIRVEADPAQVRRAIDPVISSIDPNMWSISATLEEMLRLSGPFIVSSIAATVAVAVGFFALLLALIGIYGTVSYVVVLRTREVGIRMAIGAQRRNVLGLILRETARPVLVGLVFGMLLAIGVSCLGRGWFYGIEGIDGISLAGVSSLFLAVALLASYLPARRAMSVDPLVALRYE